MLRIHFVDNRQSPVWLADETFTLGSDGSNDLVLNDVGIAPFHAELRHDNRFYYLTDLGTPNGTFVNEEKIGERYQIRSGDRVRLGRLELEIVDPAKVGAKVATAPRWLLQVVKGENQGQKYHITGSMTFGRSVKCELCFSDAELSRRHAEFYLKGDVLEVKDLASANGLLVNREKVTTAVLQPGDQVQLGNTTLLVIGPKVDAPVVADEDATVFIRAADLPAHAGPEAKPARPRPATPNPLRTAAAMAPTQAPAEHSVSRWRLGLLIGALALAVLAGVAAQRML
ncbi:MULTISPECIES: FHA domain-containing protein [Pseudomonadaceae]|jgi:pSer/pThr/pTyr-binding forkhead associated (FHA) protein|uniref:PSer/pThr/pTyr-binding forkhead associated (FHA) protein n=1 Tax=Stutzerimonas stutzeri TaxID=316 RepID=A0A5S5BJ29_STUST|nr:MULTISPECIES: FHA domain-containing protein [Pseudomonadaceae]MBU0811397.1 FHA domain-containing protein [Gammaproteobacteria bacterium]HAW24268.1 FHA domain-containing protein [Pseudomonas sp.]MBK3845438.1 FHA domain-containing protein [Stutzerimonas xanthomarina]MBK3846125.1 FHA domain-containing protein [Stutzerimonas xanthomarina]MBK3846734.1 FHA domain-containing protein [Stutzerimonas xanthomarina]|tara:strand:+ start:627 stop:1481 length:855 start_codon:yes stop_codon:yes gene_type:complete